MANTDAASGGLYFIFESDKEKMVVRQNVYPEVEFFFEPKNRIQESDAMTTLIWYHFSINERS